MIMELYHWGIKGQRWGFRRFQNEDGSLTPEGELRYNQGKQKAARGKAAEMYKTRKYKAKLALKQEKQKVKDAAALAKTAKKEQAKLNAEDRIIRKKPKNMTDEELRNEVNRLAMELDYQKKSWQVERGKKGPSALDKADEFFERPTGRIVAEVGKSIVTQVATNTLTNIIKEKTSTLEKEKIKGQQLKNKKLKAEAKKSKLDEEAAEKEYESKYGKKDKNSDSDEKKSDTKSAEDYVKDAFSGTKTSGAKGEKGQTWKKRDNNQSESTNEKEKIYTGNPFTPGRNKEEASGSTEKKGFTFDPVDPISSEYVYNRASNTVKKINSIGSGSTKVPLLSSSASSLNKKSNSYTFKEGKNLVDKLSTNKYSNKMIDGIIDENNKVFASSNANRNNKPMGYITEVQVGEDIIKKLFS